MKFWKFGIALAFTCSMFAQQPRLVRMNSVPENKMLHRVYPDYPGDALYLKVQGTVKMNIVIGADGHVESARLVSGHPLLAPAALQAVRHWIYQPVLQDDAPVRVATQVSIPFGLDREGKPLPHPSLLGGLHPEVN